MIFAELSYAEHYADVHDQLLAFVCSKFALVEAGMQGDSWIWISDGGRTMGRHLQPVGAPVWFDLASTDQDDAIRFYSVERAAAFYSTLFGWELQAHRITATPYLRAALRRPWGGPDRAHDRQHRRRRLPDRHGAAVKPAQDRHLQVRAVTCRRRD